MTRTLSIALAAFAMSAAALPFATTPALADAKAYSVIDCKVLSGAAAINTSGVLSNSSFTASSQVLCPLIRDNTALPATAVQVGFINRSSLLIGDGKFKCRVIHTNRTGSAVAAGNEIQSGETAPAGSIMSLPMPGVHHPQGPYSVRCVIPRRGGGDPVSSMNSIVVVEPDPGN